MAATAAMLFSGIGAASATEKNEPTSSGINLTTREEGNRPAPGPAGPTAFTAGANCTSSTDGRSASCWEITAPHKGLVPVSPQVNTSTQAAQIPQWCIDHAYQGVFGLRDQACEVTGLAFTTRVIESNGSTRVTGEFQANVINYEYTDKSQPTWAHQIEIAAYSGWGDALKVTLEGAASASLSCKVVNASFPPQPVEPLKSWRIGEAFYNTTATNPGDVGRCITTWNVTAHTPGYPDAVTKFERWNVRCDNNTGGNPYVGCVVFWYPSPVYYSLARNPTLANHVARAQASGLPGATFEAPLERTTDPAISGPNGQMACGDAPSIQNKQCDEYPLASSKQGLTAGGTRRTFDGCNFNLPQQTGPTGVSVCMIDQPDNSAQGGIMAQFYRWERVLDGDPFRVLVVA
ncbi:hypothetical protein OG196_14280 [Kitasatospora purpeofusca]|uniref:NucA/NucB deoxyribonuclease domain-containing protein n=1 Tax=Kitasatospora purpeofusca TaxID=67352 RepID=UPI002E11633A|nr:hypothetical protein OG196_14280 [Kitasatospora purpeofusca]